MFTVMNGRSQVEISKILQGESSMVNEKMKIHIRILLLFVIMLTGYVAAATPVLMVILYFNNSELNEYQLHKAQMLPWIFLTSLVIHSITIRLRRVSEQNDKSHLADDGILKDRDKRRK